MITTIDKNTALVLIDLQNGITQMNVAHPIKTVLEKSALLVSAFREAKLPVVVVNVNPVGLARKRTEQQGSAMTELPAGFTDIVAEIKTQAGDIFITKKTWNAFYNTSLHAELQQRNITGIVLAGVATSIGVEGTARAASELGYNISFASDAMTDRIPEAHDNSFEHIFQNLGESGTTADIIAKMSNRS
jgi:nicotinamidase-related amidase